MDIFSQTFSAAEVAAACNIAPETLQNWMKRDLIMGHVDGETKVAGGGSRGVRRQFSWENLMDIATASAFVEIGFLPTDAFKIAHRFSMVSDSGGAVWDDDPEAENRRGPYRAPSFPHHQSEGQTYLCAWGETRRVILSKDGSINPHALAKPSDRATGFACVNMTELFIHVATRADLGQHPFAILDQIYKAG